MECLICGHQHTHSHRLLPGAWGGKYNLENVVDLCPNHHADVHFLMRMWMKHGDEIPDSDRLVELRGDAQLWSFFVRRVLPICQARKLSHPVKEQRERKSPRLKLRHLIHMANYFSGSNTPRRVQVSVFINVLARELTVSFSGPRGGLGVVINRRMSARELRRMFLSNCGEVLGVNHVTLLRLWGATA